MPGPTSRQFRTGLLLILLLAAGVRTTFILGVARHDNDSFYDAAYYELQARQLAKGHGFDDPFQFLPGAPHRSRPAADHPPLTVFAILPVIAAGDGLGFAEATTQLAVRFEIMLIGLFGIGLMALLDGDSQESGPVSSRPGSRRSTPTSGSTMGSSCPSPSRSRRCVARWC